MASATLEGGPRNPLSMEKAVLTGSSKPSKKYFLHILPHTDRAHPVSSFTSARKEKRDSSREENKSSLRACDDTRVFPAGVRWRGQVLPWERGCLECVALEKERGWCCSLNRSSFLYIKQQYVLFLLLFF